MRARALAQCENRSARARQREETAASSTLSLSHSSPFGVEGQALHPIALRLEFGLGKNGWGLGGEEDEREGNVDGAPRRLLVFSSLSTDQHGVFCDRRMKGEWREKGWYTARGRRKQGSDTRGSARSRGRPGRGERREWKGVLDLDLCIFFFSVLHARNIETRTLSHPHHLHSSVCPPSSPPNTSGSTTGGDGGGVAGAPPPPLPSLSMPR